MTRSIMLVCRANLCRSPTAEVMLRVALAGTPVDADVSSSGLEAVTGQLAPPEFIDEALVRGIDLRDRVPVAFSRADARAADLIVTMTRDLLRAAVVDTPSLWPRSFTLLELVRRGVSLEPPEPDDTLEGWLARVHASRDRAELLGTDPIDDIRDPIATAAEGSAAMFDQIEQSTKRLARLLCVLSG